MIQIERTTDYAFIRACATDPLTRPWLVDDLHADVPDSPDIPFDSALWLQVLDNGERKGVFAVHEFRSVCVEIHTVLLPIARGNAVFYGRAVLKWLFTNTKAQRVITQVPSNNRLALRMARQCGMTEFGMNPKSYLKNGELLDVILLGISRPGN